MFCESERMGVVTAIPSVPDWVWNEEAAIRRFPHLYWVITHEEEFCALPESTKAEVERRSVVEFAVFDQGLKRARSQYSGDKCY
ncbi:hypothetical protein KIPB_001048 [Kipferlia bialata]|uniref:Uncharacterized protein n=1 Tax=Kipferlia bialata TaxID=797122 RepID=A0A9K3CNE4_9EUKA|nr:hypothetical protein KIPB_001048 [Kipferlia bialata]|eukprot:g1048.t1